MLCHQTHKSKVIFNILKFEGKYRKRHSCLKLRDHIRRSGSIATDIISSCTHFPLLKEQGYEYLQKNEDLAVDIATFLDEIKFRIQKELCINFTYIEEKGMTPLVEEDKVEEKCPQSVCLSLLGECTQRGYNSICISLMSQFPLITTQQIPTYYNLTKVCPKIEGFILEENMPYHPVSLDHSEDLQELNIDEILDEMMMCERKSRLRIDQHSIEDGDLSKMIMKPKTKYGAKIEGQFSAYFAMMEQKFLRLRLSLDQKRPIGVIDSFDGAEHKNSDEGITSVVSFISILFSVMTQVWIFNK